MMVAERKVENGEEVLCIFCGSVTPVPTSKATTNRGDASFQVSLVRCKACGKEAPHHFSKPERASARSASRD